jgi:hypothetical protein
MKPNNVVHVVYRNYFFYLIRFMLPRAMTLRLRVNGTTRMLRARVGDVLKISGYRDIKPVNLIESIVFSVEMGRVK